MMLSTASKLLLTAVVSLAAGAGATYAITVHVAATCAVALAQPDAGPGQFMAGPPLPTTGYPKY